MEYLCNKWPRICSTCRKHFRVLSSFTTYYGFVTRLTWRVPLVEQELLTLPEHLSSPPVFSGVRVTRSLVLYVCFEDRCLSFCTFSFGHCVVWSSSIYRFWLPPFGIFKLFLKKHYMIILTQDPSFWENCLIIFSKGNNWMFLRTKKPSIIFHIVRFNQIFIFPTVKPTSEYQLRHKIHIYVSSLWGLSDRVVKVIDF
jgi:hypothetical protein